MIQRIIIGLLLAVALQFGAAAQTTTNCGTIGSCGNATLPLTGNELLPLVQNGATKKTPVSSIAQSATPGSVSVLGFGAKCDGATNDSAAFQQGLNYSAAHGVALLLPGGTCIADTLTWPTNSTLIGPGSQLVTIQAHSAANTILNLVGPNQGGITIKGVTLTGGAVCIDNQEQSSQVIADDVYINCTAAFFVVGSMERWLFIGGQIDGVNYGFELAHQDGANGEGNYIQKLTFIGTRFTGGAIDVIYDNCTGTGGSSQVNIFVGTNWVDIGGNAYASGSSCSPSYYVFEGGTGENMSGFGGPSGTTTVTNNVNTGATSFPVASCNGIVPNNTVTIQGAVNHGSDLTATVVSCTSDTLVVGTASTQAISTGAEVALGQFDDFFFAAGNAGFSFHHFTTGGTSRYVLNGPNTVTLDNVNFDRPAYYAFSGAPANWIVTGPNSNIRIAGQANAQIGDFLTPDKTAMISTTAGGNLQLACADSGGHGAGSFGQVVVQKATTANALTTVFAVDCATGYTQGLVTTVGGLPSCTSGLRGARAVVTDASSPTFLGTLTGSSSTVTGALCNGSNWVAD